MVKEDYQPHLEGIRGAMAIWVFVGHAASACGFFTPLIPPAAIAVDVFMFLSGLLMTRNFFAREQTEPYNSKITFIKFMVRRFFRLAPLYYLLLLVAFMFQTQYDRFGQEARVAFPPPWVDLLGNDPSQRDPTILNILTHLSFSFGAFPRYAANNALPDWSFSLEMQFYAALPFILILSKRLGFTAVTLAFILIQFFTNRFIGLYLEPIGGILWPQPSILPFKINCFMVGVLMAAYFRYRNQMLIILMFFVLYGQHKLTVITVIFCFLAMSEGLEFPLAQGVLLGKRLLSGSIAQFFGRISYAVYLTHGLIFWPVLLLLSKSSYYLNSAPIIRFVVLFIISGIFIVPCSFFLHRSIELWGIDFGNV